MRRQHDVTGDRRRHLHSVRPDCDRDVCARTLGSEGQGAASGDASGGEGAGRSDARRGQAESHTGRPAQPRAGPRGPPLPMEQVPSPSGHGVPRSARNSGTGPWESMPVSVITVFVIHLENVAFLM